MKSFKSFVNENRGVNLNEGKEHSYESGDFYQTFVGFDSSKNRISLEWGCADDLDYDVAAIDLILQENGNGFILKSKMVIHPGDLAGGWVDDDADVYEQAEIKFKDVDELKASGLIKSLVRFMQGDSTIFIKRKGFEFRMNSGSKVYGELNGHKLVWDDKAKMNKEIQSTLKSNSKQVKEIVSYLESL